MGRRLDGAPAARTDHSHCAASTPSWALCPATSIHEPACAKSIAGPALPTGGRPGADLDTDNEESAAEIELAMSRRRSPTVAADSVQSDLEIAVVTTGTMQYGLVVGGFHDTEEIVVKPLGRHLKGMREYAGATILGDGTVALILDVAGLAAKANLTPVIGIGASHRAGTGRGTRAGCRTTTRCSYSRTPPTSVAPSRWTRCCASKRSIGTTWRTWGAAGPCNTGGQFCCLW